MMFAPRLTLLALGLLLRSVSVVNHMIDCLCVQVSHSACVMTTAVICKLLRSKEATATVDIRNWPPVLDTGTAFTLS